MLLMIAQAYTYGSSCMMASAPLTDAVTAGPPNQLDSILQMLSQLPTNFIAAAAVLMAAGVCVFIGCHQLQTASMSSTVKAPDCRLARHAILACA